MTDSSVHVQPMSGEEVLARAEAFDPLPNRERIMRLALETIVQQAQGGQRLHVGGTGMTAYPLIIRTAEQALKECS